MDAFTILYISTFDTARKTTTWACFAEQCHPLVETQHLEFAAFNCHNSFDRDKHFSFPTMVCYLCKLNCLPGQPWCSLSTLQRITF
jgi:hypothetical protein